MTVIDQFNNLHNKTVTRVQLQKLYNTAKKQGIIQVCSRLYKAIKTKHNQLTVEIDQPINNGLNGHHTEGLDDCGRLKKGYKFLNGKIVKVSNGTIIQKNAQKRATKPAIKKTKTHPKPIAKAKKSTNNSILSVIDIPLSAINTDVTRFQNRTQLNQSVVDNIVKNFSHAQLDPLVVWQDKNKTYLLAGHHRLEALKKTHSKTAPVKYFTGNEQQAIYYAKVESNANRTLETPIERAKIYRQLLAKEGKNKVHEKIKELEGKNANFIYNLCFLKNKGVVENALVALDKTDKQQSTLIEKIADWIGEARRNQNITNAHETEMFDFLMDKTASERFKNKAEFLNKISSITSDMYFDAAAPLNLKRFKYKTEGESTYEAEKKGLQTQLDTVIAHKQEVLDRLKNPNNPNFINPKDKDYAQVITVFDKTIDKYNIQIVHYQKQLIALQQKKGSYIKSGSNQVGLFGAKKPTPNTNKNSIASKLAERLAPNGKPSKLTAGQYKMVRTVEFKKWFGDWENSPKKASKMLDENGEPAVFYHGSGFGFNTFYPYSFFTESFEIAKRYSRQAHEGKDLNSNVYAVFLNIRKIKEMPVFTIQQDRLKLFLKFKAIDGIINPLGNSEKKEIVVRNPNQIKSATDNNGNFDANNYSFLSGAAITTDTFKKVGENKNSIASKLANRKPITNNFKIADKQIADFLGDLERKTKESVFLSVSGGQGSMKTRFAFQFMNALAQNYKVGHASIEEHPDSSVYFDKVKQYLNPTAIQNIEAPEIRSINDLHKLAQDNDVIVIDSYTKLKELDKNFEVDKDLRKKYNGKLFLVIFQQTTDGKMRGGSRSQFDADVVMFTKKEPDYRNNYVWHDKNRYQNKPLDNLHYNIYNAKIVSTTNPTTQNAFSFSVQ